MQIKYLSLAVFFGNPTNKTVTGTALMQVVHDIQMLKNNVTLHKEGKKYPMPIIEKPRLFRKDCS
jgi:hypothetical protein